MKTLTQLEIDELLKIASQPAPEGCVADKAEELDGKTLKIDEFFRETGVKPGVSPIPISLLWDYFPKPSGNHINLRITKDDFLRYLKGRYTTASKGVCKYILIDGDALKVSREEMKIRIGVQIYAAAKKKNKKIRSKIPRFAKRAARKDKAGSY